MRRNANLKDVIVLLLAFIVLTALGTIMVAGYNQTLQIWWVLAAGAGCAIGGMLTAAFVGMALGELVEFIRALRQPDEDETEEENKNE